MLWFWKLDRKCTGNGLGLFVVVPGIGSILDVAPNGKMCTGNRTASVVGCSFRKRTEMLNVQVRARLLRKWDSGSGSDSVPEMEWKCSERT